MSVQAINKQGTASIKTKKSNKNQNISIGVGTGLVGGGAIGYFKGEKITADKLVKLSDDKFEKLFSKVPEQKKEFVDELSDARETFKNIDKAVAEFVETEVGNETKGIHVEELYGAEIGNEYTENKENFERELEDLEKNNPALKKEYTEAKEAFKKANETTIIEAKENLFNAKDNLIDSVAEINISKRYTKLINNAENGIIKTDAFKNEFKASLQDTGNFVVEEALDLLGKDAPKVKSIKNAGIFGAIAAVVLGGAVAILSKKSDKTV